MEYQSGSLTEEQRQFLQMAVEQDYFAVPRGVSLKQLSDEHGISDQEGSELLREGLDIAVRKQLSSL